MLLAPKVSILVAAYNVEQYIAKCINSITNQILSDIEIIIVNDGSSDNTLEIISDFANKDNRIEIINKKNEGLLEARKSALEVATGEYILFVDGDDWLELNAVEVLYNSAKNTNSDIIIYNAYRAYDDRKEILKTIEGALTRDNIADLLLRNVSPSIWSKFLKKSFLEKNNITFASDISYAEDLTISCELFLNSPKVTYIDDTLYNYYHREGSITMQITPKVLEVNTALEFVKDKLIEKNLFNRYEKEFEYQVFSQIIDSKIVGSYGTEKKLGKKIYEQYKNYKIVVSNNKHIKNKIKKSSIIRQLRINLYCKNYQFGYIFDSIAYKVRNILGNIFLNN